MLIRFKPYLLLILISLAITLPGMSTLPLIDRDAAHFAQATRQMLDTGNYFQIRFQDVTRFQKPPGINWLQALSVSTFSHAHSQSIWPYRLPSVFGIVLAVLAWFAFCSTLIDRKTAFISAGFLAIGVLVMIEAHMAIIDAMLLGVMVLMQGCLWQVYSSDKPKPYFALGFWLFMSIGIVLKGTTPLIGLLTLAAIIVFQKNKVLLKNIKPYWGIGLLLLTTIAWVLAVNHAEHTNYVWQMIQKDLLPKLEGGHQSHGQPPGFYLLISSITLWPASLLLWPAAVFAWCTRKNKVTQFLIAWIIPNWIFYCIMPTKLPQYMLPMYPAITLLMAQAIVNPKLWLHSKKIQWSLKLLIPVWLLISLGFAASIALLPHALHHPALFSASCAALMIALTGIIGTIVMWRAISNADYFNQLPLILILGAIVSFMPLMHYALPNLKSLWVSENIAQAIRLQAVKPTPTAPLVSVGYTEPSLVFKLGTHAVEYSDLAALHSNWTQPNQLLLINQRLLNDAKLNPQTYTMVSRIQGFNYSKGRAIALVLLEKNSKPV